MSWATYKHRAVSTLRKNQGEDDADVVVRRVKVDIEKETAKDTAETMTYATLMKSGNEALITMRSQRFRDALKLPGYDNNPNGILSKTLFGEEIERKIYATLRRLIIDKQGQHVEMNLGKNGNSQWFLSLSLDSMDADSVKIVVERNLNGVNSMVGGMKIYHDGATLWSNDSNMHNVTPNSSTTETLLWGLLVETMKPFSAQQ